MSFDGWSYEKYGEYEHEWRSGSFIIATESIDDGIVVRMFDDTRAFGEERVHREVVESKREAYRVVESLVAER